MKFEEILANYIDTHLVTLLQRVGVSGEHYQERADAVDAILDEVRCYQHACRLEDDVRRSVGVRGGEAERAHSAGGCVRGGERRRRGKLCDWRDASEKGASRLD